MRYTAEYRGGDYDDDPEEWCVVDEYVSPVGCAIAFGLTKDQAISLADTFNKQENNNENRD